MSSLPNHSQTRLEVGDLVEVMSTGEILQTLDESGSLEGLPFMPEMVQHCGRRARLSCRALKTCVECLTDKRFIDIRAFGSQDVWVLEDLRCSGADHDGCQRGCLIFWKSAWLRKVEANQRPAKVLGTDAEVLLRKLKTKTAPDRYFCQSTELAKATQPLSLMGRLKLCLDDVRFGNTGVFRMIGMIVQPIFWKTFHKYVVPRHVVGPLNRTTLVKLDLAPGEMVEVKSTEEITQTLNTKGFNRGLRYDRGLNIFCGSRHPVRDRLDKMIIESTGQMVRLEGTVTLENSCCTCRKTALGGCPRKDLVYWREAWLKRVDGQASHQEEAACERTAEASLKG